MQKKKHHISFSIELGKFNWSLTLLAIREVGLRTVGTRLPFPTRNPSPRVNFKPSFSPSSSDSTKCISNISPNIMISFKGRPVSVSCACLLCARCLAFIKSGTGTYLVVTPIQNPRMLTGIDLDHCVLTSHRPLNMLLSAHHQF